MIRVWTTVLAAGKGQRLGGPKALLAWPSSTRTHIPLAIAHARARLTAESERALIVTRKSIMHALLDYRQTRIDILISEAPDDLGPAGSLAVAASLLHQPDIALITPVDTPPAHADTVARLLSRLTSSSSLLAVRPRFSGRPGHPVLLRTDALERYRQPAPPPLRDYLKSLHHQSALEDVDDPSVLIDFNTPEQFIKVAGFMPQFIDKSDNPTTDS